MPAADDYGAPGNFEVVVRVRSGQLQHFWRANDYGATWYPGPLFGGGITSPPVMIQGQHGMATEYRIGNLELCVASGGHVQH